MTNSTTNLRHFYAFLPKATGVTLIAFCLSLSHHLLVTLLASLAAFFAALLHLITFAIEIAFFARVKNVMNDLDIDAVTKPGPGEQLLVRAFEKFN